MEQSVIHVVNGDSAGGTIREALGLKPPQDLLISRDLYSCGPLLPIDSIAEWHGARKSWWAGLYADQGLDAPVCIWTPRPAGSGSIATER